jgi:hypothetical protein
MAAILIGNRADAMTVDYEFTAQVTETMGLLPFDVGDTILGTFSYRTDFPVQSSSGATTTYNSAGLVDIVVAGFSPGGNINQLLVTNGASDSFLLRSSSIFDSTHIALTDPTGSAFVSQAIPSALPLSAFSSATFELDLASFGLFAGNITSVNEVVPEPGTAALLALGLAALARRRR